MSAPLPVEHRDANGRRIKPAGGKRRRFGNSPAHCRCSHMPFADPQCHAHSELARTTAPWHGLPTLPPDPPLLSCPVPQFSIDNCKPGVILRDLSE